MTLKRLHSYRTFLKPFGTVSLALSLPLPLSLSVSLFGCRSCQTHEFQMRYTLYILHHNTLALREYIRLPPNFNYFVNLEHKKVSFKKMARFKCSVFIELVLVFMVGCHDGNHELSLNCQCNLPTTPAIVFNKNELEISLHPNSSSCHNLWKN